MAIRKEDGAGGKYMVELLKRYVFPKINSSGGEITLDDMEDSADFHEEFVITTDSYVITPHIFNGGSIGNLAVFGTSNDLAVVGAKPKFMTLSFILQEGFPISEFERIVDDIKEASEALDVKIITGDTKVVESNINIAVNTTGIGKRSEEIERNLEVLMEFRNYPYRWVRDKGLVPGDAIIINGGIAEHATTVMAARLGFDVSVKSDLFPVWLFVKDVLRVGGVSAMKDPTRGGIAAALNEMAEKSRVGIRIYEERIPVKDEVKSFCDLLGLDPLTMANEGKVIFGVVPEMAEEVLKALRKAGQRDAEIIGYATDDVREVVLETVAGTSRVIPPPISDPIPRVC